MGHMQARDGVWVERGGGRELMMCEKIIRGLSGKSTRDCPKQVTGMFAFSLPAPLENFRKLQVHV